MGLLHPTHSNLGVSSTSSLTARSSSISYLRFRPWRPSASLPGRRTRLRPRSSLGDAPIGDGKDKGEEEEPTTPLGSDDASSTELISATHNSTNILSSLKQLVPEQLQGSLNALKAQWNSIRGMLMAFIAGAILSLSLVLVPIYAQVDTMSQPVTLFETILTDLETTYVDPVDTHKLFETGISAMLRSLDPYTEFESASAATDMMESIEGRYGGVGLVISGTDPTIMEQAKRQGLSDDKTVLDRPVNDDAMSSGSRDGSSDLGGEKDVSLQPVGGPSQMVGDDEPNVAKLRTALARAQERGIRVVSAMEGYAFDYGLRVGDKLVAIDDTPITPDMTVENVRKMLRGSPGTLVDISFERVGLDGVQTISMPRSLVLTRYVARGVSDTFVSTIFPCST